MPSIEIRDLGLAKTNSLAISIKEHLRTTLPDGSFLDNALPEYVLVLLANKHSKDKIRSELASFVGEAEATEFTTWLMGEYFRLKDMELQVEDAKDMTQQTPTLSSRRPTLSSSRIFENAIKEATSTRATTTMQVDQENLERRRSSRSMRSSSPSNSRYHPRRQHHDDNFQAEKDALDRELDSFVNRRRAKSPPVQNTRQQRVIRVRPDREYGRSRDKDQENIRQEQNLVVQGNDENQNDADDVSAVPKKCQFWPHCKAGDDCTFIHPSEPCKFFPSCTFGDQCIYIHPILPCKFQDKCANPLCNYQHKSPSASAVNSAASLGLFPTTVAPTYFHSLGHPAASTVSTTAATSATAPMMFRSAAQSTIICRYHPKCINPQCTFLHPSPVSCRYGESCLRPDCVYTHPPTRHSARSKVMVSCRFGRNCSRVGCPFLHENIATTIATSMTTTQATLTSSNTDNITNDTSGITPPTSLGNSSEDVNMDHEKTFCLQTQAVSAISSS